MTNLTIHNLRKDFNWKCRVNHFRLHIANGIEYPIKTFRETKNQHAINSKGGRTLIEITDTKGNNYSFESKCSKKDSFNRKLGISICLGRLSKQLGQIQEIEKNS